MPEPSASSKPKETEPNDSPEQASAFHLLQEFRPISGELSTAADIDWVQLTAQQEGLYELTVVPQEGLDVMIHLSGNSQISQPVTYNIAGSGEGESVPMVWLDSKPVFFALQSVGSMAGSYEITALRKLTAGNLEREPNDSIETARTLELADEVQGMFERPNDRDVYVIASQGEGDSIVRIDYNPAPNVPQVLRLYDDPKLSTPLSSLQIGEGSKPVVVPAFKVAHGTKVYLVLSSISGFDRQAYYTLKTTRLEEIALDVEVEPNDRIPQTLHGNTMRGAFHSPEDTDRFVPAKIDVAPIVAEASPAKSRWKRSLQIAVAPLRETVSLGVSLMLSGVETRLESDETAGAQGCGILYSPEDLEIVVRPIELRALGEMFDYQLTISHLSDDPLFEIEPNDTRAEADVLESHRTGVLETSAATDVFVFEVLESLERIQLSAGGKGLNLTLRLEDEEGGLIAESNIDGAAIEKIEVDLPPGRYFAIVGFAGEGRPICELYRVSVSREVLVLERQELPKGTEEKGQHKSDNTKNPQN